MTILIRRGLIRPGFLARMAIAVVAVMAVAGCSVLQDPNGARKTAEGTIINDSATDRALAALNRGDYPAAERNALLALRYNPKDPLALTAAGLAYQGMGRYDVARQYYEVIITNRIPGSIVTPGENGVAQPRSVVEVAQANMATIDRITGRNVAMTAKESGALPGAPAVGAPPYPEIPVVNGAGRPVVSGTRLDPIAAASTMGAGAPRVTDAETNVAGRFRILKRLLGDGLITPDEYYGRRMANIGALLPYTQKPPARGLERPVPNDEAVIARLREIAHTLETKAMTPAEHAAERTTILDALLPEHPLQYDVPPLPPRDLLEAGDAVGRVERLRTAGLVSDAEAAREKEAIRRSLDGHLAGQPVDGTASGMRAGPSSSTSSSGWGVALASAKSEAGAKSEWARIKAKYPVELGALDAHIKRTTKGKAVRYRVVAGPVADKSAATSLCKSLKLHRQSCDPASF